MNKRTDSVWRAFLVAQAQAQHSSMRRREMTTQRIFLLGNTER